MLRGEVARQFASSLRPGSWIKIDALHHVTCHATSHRMKVLSRVLFVAFSLRIISLAQADTLWRQYGFNAAHTSYNQSETILDRWTVSRLTLFWSSDTFKAVATAPTLGFNSVFVASDGRVRALDKQTGARRWVRLSCSGEGTQQPALGHGLLLVGDGGGDLPLTSRAPQVRSGATTSQARSPRRRRLPTTLFSSPTELTRSPSINSVDGSTGDSPRATSIL